MYRTNVRINDVLECKVASGNEHSNRAIVVFNRHGITGHVPDKLDQVLYQSLNDNIIKMKGCITGVPQPAEEGTWGQGGAIDAPCNYILEIEKERKIEHKQLRTKLKLLIKTLCNQ